MIQPYVDIDLEDVDKAIKETKRRGRDLSPAWRDLAPFLKEDQLRNFEERRGPDSKWAPRAKATRERNRHKRPHGSGRKKAPRGPRSKQLGALGKAFRIEWGKLVLRARNMVDWSAAHQEGATVGRGAQLPQRVHHWASNALMDRIKKRIDKHLHSAW